MDSEQVLEERKKKAFHYLVAHKALIAYVLLGIILLLGFNIRVQNLPSAKDVTTNDYVPIEPDSFAFLHYSEYILEHGKMMDFDPYRYYPTGYYPGSEFSFLSYAVVWLYKFLHVFNKDITLATTQVIYPPLAFVAGGFFFFLLVRKLFDWRVATLATAYLAVIPPFLYRTIAGFSDKEALGMVFFFMALYFFVVSWQTKTLKKGLVIAALTGLISALMGLAWGGVQFLYLIIGLFALYEFIFSPYKKRDFFAYTIWLATFIVFTTVIFSTRSTFTNLVLSETMMPAMLAFVVGLSNYILGKFHLLTLKKHLEQKMPFGVSVSILTVLFLLFIDLIRRGLAGFISHYRDLTIGTLTPFATSRWGRTVAESHQPYIADWFSQFGNLYFYLFIIGVLLLVYSTFALSRKWRIAITAFFGISLIAFLASRYSSTPPFDGASPLANVLYFGSMILLAGFLFGLYVYAYKKRPELYAKIILLKREYLFALMWAVVMLLTARIAIRILFVFAPVTAVMVGYLFIRSYDFSRTLKHRSLYIVIALFIIYILVSPTSSASLLNYYTSTSQSARYMGTSYNQQWQVAMKWVRENTPADAVFAHWWDYGYFVLAKGKRATLTDGGNNGGPALNHFMGRNVLTGGNATEALAFLKVKGATHLLIVSDEVGKYGAFSSIGSNLTYDRFSAISTFSLDPTQVMEQRNQTIVLYRGNVAFDEDVFWQGKLYPAYSSGVVGVVIPFGAMNNLTTIHQPQAIVVYKNEQVSIPLKCLFIEGKERVYPGEGLDACFQIIPVVQDSQGNMIGAGLYLPNKIYHTLFAHMYLFNQKWDGFSLAYSDEGSIPLAVYNGRLAGPLKIWNISYPPDIPYEKNYERTDLPDPRLANV